MPEGSGAENEEVGSTTNAGPKAKLKQLSKRKKTPAKLNRIVDCLHYQVCKHF